MAEKQDIEEDGARAAPRFQLRVPVEFESSSIRGSGTIWNISMSGALIEQVSIVAPPGMRIEIRSSFFPGSFQIPLWGEVVRETNTGFAARFDELNPEQERLLRTALPEAALGT